jgi:hypothetical protein
MEVRPPCGSGLWIHSDEIELIGGGELKQVPRGFVPDRSRRVRESAGEVEWSGVAEPRIDDLSVATGVEIYNRLSLHTDRFCQEISLFQIQKEGREAGRAIAGMAKPCCLEVHTGTPHPEDLGYPNDVVEEGSSRMLEARGTMIKQKLLRLFAPVNWRHRSSPVAASVSATKSLDRSQCAVK